MRGVGAAWASLPHPTAHWALPISIGFPGFCGGGYLELIVDAGKRLETRNKIPGNRPFIGATDIYGNDITGFIGNDNISKDKNVLGVNYNGASCIAFYHQYECIFTDDVKRLHLIHHGDTYGILLFFTSVFAQLRIKYNYGYKFNERRMLRQKLMLPVTDSGEPDYGYMEQYAKHMMIRKYWQYLSFLDAKYKTETVQGK